MSRPGRQVLASCVMAKMLRQLGQVQTWPGELSLVQLQQLCLASSSFVTDVEASFVAVSYVLAGEFGLVELRPGLSSLVPVG